MCINFYINLEYIIALKWKTWNIKWDRSLRRLLWILCKSTKCSWRIAQCDSSKRNQRETRIGGFFRIGCSSKINIILVSQNHIVCIYFICQIVMHRNFFKVDPWSNWRSNGNPRCSRSCNSICQSELNMHNGMCLYYYYCFTAFSLSVFR